MSSRWWFVTTVLVLVLWTLVGVKPVAAQLSGSIQDFVIFSEQEVYLHPKITALQGIVGSDGLVTAGGSGHLLNVTGGTDFSGGTNLQIDGNLLFDGNVVTGGTSTILGNVSAGVDADIALLNQVGGHITSGGNSTVGKQSTVGGNINSGGTMTTGFLTSVTGNVIAAGAVDLNGQSIQIGGNLDAGGTVRIRTNSSVTGNVTSANTVTLEGTASVGGTLTQFGVPQTPTAPPAYQSPSLPTPTSFTSGGANIIKGNGGQNITNLAPGSYGQISLGTFNTLNLTSGIYELDALSLGGSAKINFDVSAGPVKLYVTGDANFGRNIVTQVIGGDASNVWAETASNWSIGNGSQWAGTIYAPAGEIKLGSTSTLSGAFWAGGLVEIDDLTTVDFVPFDDPSPAPDFPCPGCLFAVEGLYVHPKVHLYGGKAATNGDVYWGGAGLIEGGLEANGNIVLNGNGFTANYLLANGYIQMNADNTFVLGNVDAGLYIDAGQLVDIDGHVVAGGDAAFDDQLKLDGNLDSGGNVTLENLSTILGNVTAAGAINANASTTIAGTTTPFGSPITPATYTPGVLPPASVFASGGDSVVKGNSAVTYLAPDSYGMLQLGNLNDLYLSSGDYFFDSFTAGGNLDLYLDLTGGPIRISVTGDVQIGVLLDMFLTGGDAGDVWLESHGQITVMGTTEWYGFMFAPYDDIYIGSNGILTGKFWSGGVITVEDNTKFYCLDCNILPPPNSQDDPPSTPEPSTAVFLTLASMVMMSRRFSRGRRRIA